MTGETALSGTTELRSVRDVTDDEVAFFQNAGWVKLDGLIDEGHANALFAAARGIMASGERDGKPVNPRSWWDTYYHAAKVDRLEPFSSLVFASGLGGVARRMMSRDRLTDVPVAPRLVADLLTRKRRAGETPNAATSAHTDQPAYPIDRVGGLSFWIALDEIPPERGSMRFLSGSHREGLLGRAYDVLEEYPKLEQRYEWSPPLHLRPGDATVHDWRVVHGGPQNTTDRDRWAYVIGLMPGDCRYTGMPASHFDDLGLEVGAVIEHASFPAI